jgi:hypothetical protein
MTERKAEDPHSGDWREIRSSNCGKILESNEAD